MQGGRADQNRWKINGCTRSSRVSIYLRVAPTGPFGEPCYGAGKLRKATGEPSAIPERDPGGGARPGKALPWQLRREVG